MLVLPSAYFPSLAYVQALKNANTLLLDYHEHFLKQSIRTRCEILSANGVLQLNVPVVHNGKQALSEVAIDYSKNWQAEHLRAIESAYANAPHFEHYQYDIQQLFAQPFSLLTQLNEAILAWITTALGLELQIDKSLAYTNLIKQDKKEWMGRAYEPTQQYVQVFEDRFGFVSNLSVLDGLMNEGPLLRRHFLPS